MDEAAVTIPQRPESPFSCIFVTGYAVMVKFTQLDRAVSRVS